jgi:hypothetical protein
MRRRLKFASLFYDRLFLETGIFRVNAGPHGSSSFILPPTEGDPPRWQTPAERRAGTGVTFAVAVSPDGRPDVAPRTLIASEATIAWTATLHPFAAELPSGTDWVEFRTSRDPAGEIQQLAQQWIGADERNRSLEQTIPIKFVRDTLITGFIPRSLLSGSTISRDGICKGTPSRCSFRMLGSCPGKLLPTCGVTGT